MYRLLRRGLSSPCHTRPQPAARFPMQPPDPQTLFMLHLLVVSGLAAFSAGVFIVVVRRLYLRRLEEERMIAVGSAAARILHQIKNPLQSLMLQAEVLQDPRITSDAETRREACEAITGEAERMGALLGELGAWAAGAGRTFRKLPLRLHELVGTIADLERAIAHASGVRLEADRLDSAVITGDEYYLRQAIENVVANAREAAAERPGGEVIVRLEHADRTAVVKVEDNGPGVSRQKMREIFQPFVSTKSHGMGLGLSISREIVEAHGGKIELRSRPGSGTLVQISLPLSQEQS